MGRHSLAGGDASSVEKGNAGDPYRVVLREIRNLFETAVMLRTSLKIASEVMKRFMRGELTQM